MLAAVGSWAPQGNHSRVIGRPTAPDNADSHALLMPGLIALALAYVFSQFYRSFLSVITPQLSADLGMDKGELSLAAGIWFVSFALMQFVVGPALDRVGPRRTAAWMFGAGAGSGTLLFAIASSPVEIILAMALIGIGCSPVLMASVFIFARRFDAARLAILLSSLVAFGNLGNVVGTSPMANAVDAFGWRTVVAGLGVMSILTAMAVGLLVRDPPIEATDGSGLKGYLMLIKIPALWLIIPMILMCYAPVANLRGLWSGPYLNDLHSADSIAIGQVTLWMALAMVAGSFLYGPLDRWLGTRKWVILGGNLAVLLALITLAANPVPSITMVTGLFVLIGICGTSYGVLMAHGRAFVPPHLLGRGVTLLNFCSIFGAGAMQFVSGAFMETRSDPTAAASYQQLFILYTVLLAATLLIYLFSKDAPPGKAMIG